MQFKRPRAWKRKQRDRAEILEARKEKQIALAAEALHMKPEAIEPFHKLVVNEKEGGTRKIIKG